MAASGVRIVLNRRALSAVELGLGDGMLEMTQQIIAAAHPPDAAPFGAGLVTTGGSVVFVHGRKIGGTASRPPGARLQRRGITGLVGFGFPGRFQEFGTVHHRAQPFLMPATNDTIPGASGHMRRGIARRVPR